MIQKYIKNNATPPLTCRYLSLQPYNECFRVNSPMFIKPGKILEEWVRLYPGQHLYYTVLSCSDVVEARRG